MSSVAGDPHLIGIQLDTGVHKSDDTVPMHIANLLKLVLLHDKFNKVFVRWSLVPKPDRDVLVLTVKLSAIIDSSLVYTMCMMYPFRIHGPILTNQFLNIEFLHTEPLLHTVSFSQHTPPKNVEYALLRVSAKWSREETEITCASLSDPTKQPSTLAEHKDDVATLRKKLHQALQHTNPTRIFVQNTTSGVDVGGTWVSFEVEQCDKLNLDFLGFFHLSLDAMAIKVLMMGPLVGALHA